MAILNNKTINIRIYAVSWIINILWNELFNFHEMIEVWGMEVYYSLL